MRLPRTTCGIRYFSIKSEDLRRAVSSSSEPDMTRDVIVRARINGAIKEEATTVLAAIGLTPSDAFRSLMTRIAADKALPFEPLIPNTATIEAMKAARRGELEAVTPGRPRAELDADD
jgi:DNA-damage-inducible protein J